jgi:hypothetical protein
MQGEYMQTMLRSVLVAILVLTSIQSAWAIGFGAYFEYGNVFDATLEDDGFDFDYDEDHFGAGLSVDTNVASDKLFNYRLDLGYQRVEQDFHSGPGLDGDGLVLDNAFGFGVLRNENVRLWIGPGVRLSFDFFDSKGFDGFDFGIGAGPVIGLNIHTGDLVSLGVTGGYQVSYVRSVDDGSGPDLDGYEQLAFLKLHTLFRIGGDSY